ACGSAKLLAPMEMPSPIRFATPRNSATRPPSRAPVAPATTAIVVMTPPLIRPTLERRDLTQNLHSRRATTQDPRAPGRPDRRLGGLSQLTSLAAPCRGGCGTRP